MRSKQEFVSPSKYSNDYSVSSKWLFMLYILCLVYVCKMLDKYFAISQFANSINLINIAVSHHGVNEILKCFIVKRTIWAC